MNCKICRNEKGNQKFKIKEMMFGSGEEFLYFQCADCGCLQIAEIPSDMGRYYPSSYSSFKKTRGGDAIRRFLKRKGNEYLLFKKGLIGKIVYRKCNSDSFDIIGGAGINYNSRILDVGCGSGNLLRRLNEAGLRNLLGVDPFISKEVVDGDIRILKKTIDDLPDTERFDVIIFNHSFEHTLRQAETLLKVRKVLSEKGVCLIRMPVKTEYIWNRYGVDWIQIDAPRHFFIHTLKSFSLLVEESGLVIQDVIFDSTEFQFWGSEQYKKGVPYQAENSYLVNPKGSIFTSKQIREFRKMAEELNIKKQGDQAAFYLRHR